MTIGFRFRGYLKQTPGPAVFVDVLRALALLASPFLAWLFLRWTARTDVLLAPVHRRLWANPNYSDARSIYLAFITLAVAGNLAWPLRAVRNFIIITVSRSARPKREQIHEHLSLPPWPYTRESFAVTIGELQDRDGSRVSNQDSPHAKPRWLILPELSLYTGVFVTGGIGSGKTSAVAYPALRQLLGFRRHVSVRRKDGSVCQAPWTFSGLIMDEKGDFTRAAAQYAEEWGRADDIVRICPGGKWIWNVIYNPNLPTWAVAYQLGWILKNFNKGASGGDPFWENAPKELVTDYLGLLDDARGYYTLFDYLETLVDDSLQDSLHEQAMGRFARDPLKVEEMERRWKSIMRRRKAMSVNLRGSLEACARAGIDMFRFPELRSTFCPTKDEYFERDPVRKVLRPRANVFTGFDQALDYGRVVGLEMPKQIYFDAAVFIQVALKSQWQDSVLRREAIGPDGTPLMPPRFGERIGYCPTFLMADEAQQSATPKDAEFKAVCRSKRASMWELTQSHGSIKGSFGPSNQAHAATYFQNSMTHIYLRQADVDSMKIIQEECGKKLVQKTSLAITEGGMSSELSYIQGGIVHQGLGLSSTKTVATEEKPFVEIDELKQLPNNVAIVLPSNGDRSLPATVAFLRPLWVQKKYPILSPSTPWLDWPAELRATYDLDTIPQELNWTGWGTSEPLDEGAVVPAESRLGKLIQPADEEHVVSGTPPLPPLVVPSQPNVEPAVAVSAPSQSPPELPPLLLHHSACPTPEQEQPDLPREGDPFSGMHEDF
jgi:hypothetical protein